MITTSPHRAKGAWIVTGSASGLGRELARQLAAAGHDLALWDLNPDGLEQTRRQIRNVSCSCHEVDVSRSDAVRRAMGDTVAQSGPIAHVVHSAGVLRTGPFEEVSAADHELMMRINYLGSVHVAQAALPFLRSVSGRTILAFIASVAGLRGFPELAGYSASKFAVVGFAQAIRAELEGSNIDVRVFCPPAARTPMVEDLSTLPPIYKLSPLVEPRAVVDAIMTELDRPGWLHLLDTRSKALKWVDAVAPGLLDKIVQRTIR